MARMLITGGAGFIGSHAAEYFAGRGYEVTVLDNLSRSLLLGKPDANSEYNWRHLEQLGTVRLVRGDVCDAPLVESLVSESDVIIHAAAQTAVTTSVVDPAEDFRVNAMGTFTVLEAARKSNRRPTLIYCSTNKVYGENVNAIGVEEGEYRYRFPEQWVRGIPESFSIDNCEHTPYGCSKLTGDVYVQDFGHLYGLRTGVFRMSCIYGTRQFGVEDQGWVAWFAIAAVTGRKITIYGDGKQVRDVLWVEDLIRAYEAFIESDLGVEVFNMGGGPEKTLSLLELLQILEQKTGAPVEVEYADWRPSDQKVYISDITRAKELLHWSPRVTPEEGVSRLVQWVSRNKDLFS